MKKGHKEKPHGISYEHNNLWLQIEFKEKRKNNNWTRIHYKQKKKNKKYLSQTPFVAIKLQNPRKLTQIRRDTEKALSFHYLKGGLWSSWGIEQSVKNSSWNLKKEHQNETQFDNKQNTYN